MTKDKWSGKVYECVCVRFLPVLQGSWGYVYPYLIVCVCVCVWGGVRVREREKERESIFEH